MISASLCPSIMARRSASSPWRLPSANSPRTLNTSASHASDLMHHKRTSPGVLRASAATFPRRGLTQQGEAPHMLSHHAQHAS